MRWVRYNVRYVADPIAVASEAWCIFRALPEAAEEGGWWYYWCLVVALAGYVPGRWFLRWGEKGLMWGRIGAVSVYSEEEDGEEEEGVSCGWNMDGVWAV